MKWLLIALVPCLTCMAIRGECMDCNRSHMCIPSSLARWNDSVEIPFQPSYPQNDTISRMSDPSGLGQVDPTGQLLTDHVITIDPPYYETQNLTIIPSIITEEPSINPVTTVGFPLMNLPSLIAQPPTVSQLPVISTETCNLNDGESINTTLKEIDATIESAEIMLRETEVIMEVEDRLRPAEPNTTMNEIKSTSPQLIATNDSESANLQSSNESEVVSIQIDPSMAIILESALAKYSSTVPVESDLMFNPNVSVDKMETNDSSPFECIETVEGI